MAIVAVYRRRSVFVISPAVETSQFKRYPEHSLVFRNSSNRALFCAGWANYERQIIFASHITRNLFTAEFQHL